MKHSESAPAAIRPDLGSELVQDLAILCDGPMVDLQISFDGGLMAMRSNDKLVFQEVAEGRWMRMNGAARARILAGWIHTAAVKYRALLAGRLGTVKTSEVA
jgi:hypothetical protein